MHVLVIAPKRNCSFTALFTKNPRILISIEINAYCGFCRIIWFANETRSFRNRSCLFIDNDPIQHPCFAFKNGVSEKANSYYVKVEFFIHGKLYPP